MISPTADESDERIIAVAGPTASGKTAFAIALAKEHGGEIISVDSRQVYRMLDIGTEKISREEMQGVPHHLIDIRDPKDSYSAGDFVEDATRLISEIRLRGNVPILAGGTHFYFDALMYGLPVESPVNVALREELASFSSEVLIAKVRAVDPRRAERLDPKNRRRTIRALEIIAAHGTVPERTSDTPKYAIEWHVLNPERDELRARIRRRLMEALDKGLIEEVRTVREYVGDERLNELGLEYAIVGEYLRGEREKDSLLPTLSDRVWHYARRQKAWLRKLELST
ncbi:MAG: tRNA delta(2)-isopentenylpyrophosphate transferase [Parcubacteria group bacterium]|nr:tRNA delta(2)-isopentenylpyrophosphate transferase [Parcubacteria group bacterium]